MGLVFQLGRGREVSQDAAVVVSAPPRFQPEQSVAEGVEVAQSGSGNAFLSR